MGLIGTDVSRHVVYPSVRLSVCVLVTLVNSIQRLACRAISAFAGFHLLVFAMGVDPIGQGDMSPQYL